MINEYSILFLNKKYNNNILNYYLHKYVKTTKLYANTIRQDKWS